MSYPIYHSGILNMKWGQRRFQYHDGTYTPLGKARRRKGGESYAKPAAQPAAQPVVRTAPSPKPQPTNNPDDPNSSMLLRKPMQMMTDKELNSAFKRVELENKYLKEMTTKAQYAKGQTKFAKAMKTVGAVTVAAGTIGKAGGAIVEGVNKVGLAGNRMNKFVKEFPTTAKSFENAYVSVQKTLKRYKSAAAAANAMKGAAK